MHIDTSTLMSGSGTACGVRRALLVRSRADDASRFAQALKQALGMSWDVVSVQDLPTAIRAVQGLSGLAAVVLDVGGWTRHVTGLLRRCRGTAARVPIIALVGQERYQRDMGMDAIRAGACCCVPGGMDDPVRTARAVENALP
jgi:DNA-binding NtrC family response regulator